MSLYWPDMETGKPVPDSCFSRVRSYVRPELEETVHSVMTGGQASIVL